MKTKLQQALNGYFEDKNRFIPYYKSMKQIVSSELFQEQLKAILDALDNNENGTAKKFKLYLDTVIINMQSKISKYKASAYLEYDNVKEIENQGYIIPFFCDEEEEVYVLLGIFKKDDCS